MNKIQRFKVFPTESYKYNIVDITSEESFHTNDINSARDYILNIDPNFQLPPELITQLTPDVDISELVRFDDAFLDKTKGELRYIPFNEEWEYKFVQLPPGSSNPLICSGKGKTSAAAVYNCKQLILKQIDDLGTLV